MPQSSVEFWARTRSARTSRASTSARLSAGSGWPPLPSPSSSFRLNRLALICICAPGPGAPGGTALPLARKSGVDQLLARRKVGPATTTATAPVPRPGPAGAGPLALSVLDACRALDGAGAWPARRRSKLAAPAGRRPPAPRKLFGGVCARRCCGLRSARALGRDRGRSACKVRTPLRAARSSELPAPPVIHSSSRMALAPIRRSGLVFSMVPIIARAAQDTGSQSCSPSWLACSPREVAWKIWAGVSPLNGSLPVRRMNTMQPRDQMSHAGE
mmetsp:Transcript_6568/g.16735  ORF Transcript_6568/g.16735 Transcript_6568/m.16735 type:complete len:273 (+) Transcript_6568:597-1415(+)